MNKVKEVSPPPISSRITNKLGDCTDMIDVLIEFKDAMNTIRTMQAYADINTSTVEDAKKYYKANQKFALECIKGLEIIINQELL